MNTNPPPLKKPRLRKWRLLGYLVLSLFLWWGVGKLLEPWPLWSKTYTDGKGLLPLYQQENGPYLLGTEYRHFVPGAGTSSMEPLALLVIDKQTGQALHRLTSSDHSLMYNYEASTIPNIQGDVIWRLSIERNSWGAIYRLCSWNFKEENTERTVHTWNVPDGSYFGFNWPLQSRIFVIRRQWPSMLQFWKNPLNPLIVLSLDMKVGELSHDMPCWFETWQLPDKVDQPLRKLAQWPMPYDRIDAHWGCSDDGKRLVLMEPEGNKWLAESRARASGKQVFRGNELFNLYRSDAKGMLLYDTSTGKSIQHIQEDFAPHTMLSWHDQYLITVGKKENTSIEFSLKDFSQDEHATNPKIYTRVFSNEYHIHRVDDQLLHRVTIPQHYREAGVRFSYDESMLVGRSEQINELHQYLLQIENNQLNTLNHFQTHRESNLQFQSWLPQSDGKQFLVYADSPWLKSVKDWQGKWTVLDWLLKKVEDRLESSPRLLQVHSGEPGSRSTHSFDLYPVMRPNAMDSKLYLAKTHYDELKSITGSTLYAYSLPIQLYSPWWARVAAMLPWLWLIGKRLRSSRNN